MKSKGDIVVERLERGRARRAVGRVEVKVEVESAPDSGSGAVLCTSDDARCTGARE